MSFELTDEEAEEVQYTVGRKLEGVEKVLERAEKGAPIMGKNKLLERLPVMKELVERLNEKYPKKKA